MQVDLANSATLQLPSLHADRKWENGGFKHDFYFPFYIWDVILPIDFHIFQDG